MNCRCADLLRKRQSKSDVQAEFIWLSPEVGAGGPFGGDDGLGGYAPLAVATPDASATIELNWIYADHLGTPLIETDATGALATTPDDYLAPAFPGQSRMFADLYYNRYRDYDPTTGRYIEADPIGLDGGDNPFAYAGDNPIDAIDPTGQCLEDFCIIEGIVIWGGIDFLWQRYIEGRSIECIDWRSVAISAVLGGAGAGIGRLGSIARETSEFSHAVPARWFRPLTLSGKNLNPEFKPWLKKLLPDGFTNSPWNGNYVSPKFHALTDPYRFLKGMTKADKLSAPLRYFLRIPTIYAYPASGVAVGTNIAAHSN